MEGYLSVKESVETYIENSQAKSLMSSTRLFWKAVLAGSMIGFGAAASSVAAHTIPDVGLARLVAALVFPVGLMMVILLGAELFTGDCLITMGVMDGRQKLQDVIRILTIVYIGNFVGATLLTFFVSMSGQLDYSGGMLGAYTIKVAIGKVNLSFAEGIVSGALCNILVCAAVLMALCAKDIAGKLLAIFFTIMLFVTAGFEHCVANMYYIAAGLIAKGNPEYVKLAIDTYGFTPEQLDSLNLVNYVWANLLPVTIGNIIGGVLLFGVPMFLLNTKKEMNINKTVSKEENGNDVLCTTGFADVAR